MVISSGLPYAYHSGSWLGAESGIFRFLGQRIQPSAIHFEETMFALKSEYNRVVNRVSGYHSKTGMPWFFLNTNGRFQKFLNNRGSGDFNPNPSGAYLGGILPLTNFAINTDAESAVTRPGAIHQSGYIESMRKLFDFIFEYYGAQGGAWATGAGTEPESGAKADWLRIYKGYTDSYARSGMWYHQDISQVGGDITFRVSGIFDRYLDEVRAQPIPYFGLDAGLNMTELDHLSPWGNTRKMNHMDFPVVRPRYISTNATFPSGWPSGLEMGRDNSISPGSGIGGHLVSGTSLVISGGGSNGLGSNTALLSGIYDDTYIHYMDNDTRPDSPGYIRIKQIGARTTGTLVPTTLVSGQYRIFLGHQSGGAAFPWRIGLGTHKSAQWPWEGEYEPVHGALTSVNGDFFDLGDTNKSFWVTNHMFVVQGDHGGTSATPRLSSGIYWFHLNQGPSHSIALLDAWTQESEPAGGVVAGDFYQSGIMGLWGLTKRNSVRTQFSVGGIPTQFMVGCGWDFDRTNNYYFKVGHSGLNTTSVEASGIYNNFNQQMVFKSGGVIPRTTIGSINWNPYRPKRAVEDGTQKWLFSCIAQSGSTSDPLAADSVGESCWLRLNSSLAIQDGLIFAGADTSNFWPVYLRSKTEYLGLRPDAAVADADKINGGSGSTYYAFSSITWGGLSSIDSTGSGVYTKTQYIMTYDAQISAYLNRATATAINRIHIGTFFEQEETNQVYCTLMAFASGAASGTTNVPDFWVASVDAASHPFNVTNVWRLGSAGTSYANITADASVGDVDIGSMAHMQVHQNG